MLNMVKGCSVPFPEKLMESYEVRENRILANVNAEKIEEVLRHFITMNEEPQFFILELPVDKDAEKEIRLGVAETFHKDVYYIDGCTQEEALTVLLETGDLLINDGLCCFGFGCHKSGDEIMVYKYNIIVIYSKDLNRYNNFFETHEIQKVNSVVTAWDTFSKKQPGVSQVYFVNGKSVFDIPKKYKDWGIYLAERREE